jgi:XTP/dITP diphosphohydrolase
MDTLCEKLIYRHPHIYGDVKADNAEQVTQNWEQLKQKEKGGNKSVLAGVPNSMPALLKAYRIQEKARAVGFDWERPEQVFDKVKEELQEFESEVKNQDQQNAEKEFGDLLFSLINYARFLNINPEDALEQTNQKFIKRFAHMENRVKEQGKQIADCDLAELDGYWNEAKKL